LRVDVGRVAGGVYRVRVPLPIRALGSVNSYLVETRCGPALVDPGMHYAPGVLALLRGLRLLGVRPGELAYVAVTHFHVDHLTAAAVLREALGVRVLVPRGDLEEVLGYEGGVEGFIRDTLALFTRHGMPRGEAEEILGYHPALRAADAYEALAGEAEPLEAGGALPCTDMKAYPAPGHTPGHLVYSPGPGAPAIVGDTLLPGITPHVTLHREDSNPLGDYLETLKMLRGLAPAPALPGHRDPIPRGDVRAEELARHHEERLAEIHGILSSLGEATAYEVARRVKWRARYRDWSSYPPPERFFAMGETLAHLRLLEERGLAERREERGTVKWRAL